MERYAPEQYEDLIKLNTVVRNRDYKLKTVLDALFAHWEFNEFKERRVGFFKADYILKDFYLKHHEDMSYDYFLIHTRVLII